MGHPQSQSLHHNYMVTPFEVTLIRRQAGRPLLGGKYPSQDTYTQELRGGITSLGVNVKFACTPSTHCCQLKRKDELVGKLAL